MFDNGMKVVQKYVDLTKYVYVVLRNFPKSEKYTMAGDIRAALWEAGGCLNRASDVKYRPRKLAILEKADERLADLRFLVRIGMEMNFMPFAKYENFSEMVAEVGRMLGGWLKTTRSS
jgi:four helix bundle protein